MKKRFMKGTLALAFSAALMLGVAGISKPAIAATEETDKTEEEMVDINEETFPDANFRAYVKDEIDIDGDGQLSKSEIEECTEIEVKSKKIESLEGIGYFTELTLLDCSGNNLTSLDISDNVKLLDFVCRDNNLTSIDVSNNPNLTQLHCSGNNLTSLDVSNNTELKYFGCGSNNLTSLDVSNNTKLISLAYANNNITDIRLDNNKSLMYLGCDGNGITSLDISNCTELTELDCRENNLTSLDISNNIALQKLCCDENNLTSLDTSNNVKLISLMCSDDSLAALDLTNNTELRALTCKGTNLTVLDVRNNIKLTELRCSGNKLTELYMGENKNLVELDCSENSISVLDVSKATALTTLYCTNNNLTSLDVSNNKKLETLWCEKNELTELNVEGAKSLISLRCYNNKLTSLDVSSNIRLEYVDCDSNSLTSLNVNGATSLASIYCTENNLESLDLSNNPLLNSDSVNVDSGVEVIYSSDVDKMIPIDEEHFPDAIFREYISEEIDNDEKDGYLSVSEIMGCKSIGVSPYSDIESLTGIELFINLQELYAAGTNITNLDLSNNTKLEYLYCFSDNLTNLDLSNNLDLTYLDCSDNSLTSLDVSNNTELTEIKCYKNNLTALDVSNNTALKNLDCTNNNITTVTVVAGQDTSGFKVDSGVTMTIAGQENSLENKVVVSTPALPSVANTQTGIKVTWKKATNATGYVVYRKASGGKWTKIKTLSGADTLSYIDTAVAKNGGTIYSYTVQAYNTDVNGTITNSAYDTTGKSIIRLPQVTLGNPVNTANAVTVKWGKVTGADGYIVYRKTGSAKNWTKIATISDASTLSYEDTAVAKKSGSTYSYTVQAYNKDANGAVTNSTYDTTGKSIIRLTQVTLATPVNTAKGVTVKWKKVSGSAGYIVYRKAGSAKSWTKVATVKGNKKVSYLDKKAKTNGTKYTYTVKAYYGSSVGSANQTGKTIYYVKGTSLTSAKNSASKKATIKWKKNAKATGYQIQYSTSSKFADENTVTVKNAATVSKTISKLTKGKTYYVRIRAYKKVGSKTYYSAWSASKKVKVSK
jgi:Leucine-rich repeat (LRR) protein